MNTRFHLFVAQTREIHILTRVCNVLTNIGVLAFHLILGYSYHGMLILGPLAAQLSYLLTYWAHAPPGQIYYCPGARLGLRPPSRIRVLQTPTSSLQVLISDFEASISSFQAPTSRLQAPISMILGHLDGQAQLTPRRSISGAHRLRNEASSMILW